MAACNDPWPVLDILYSAVLTRRMRVYGEVGRVLVYGVKRPGTHTHSHNTHLGWDYCVGRS